MKKVFKRVFLIIIIAILAVDIYGIWKYKLNGTKYVTYVASEDSGVEQTTGESINEYEQYFDDSNIEYEPLKNKDFSGGQKLFIIDIEEAPGQNKYKLKGLIYEEYSITAQEYTKLKNSKETIEIYGVTYTKDKIQAGNLMLKPVDDDVDSEYFYIKYNSATKKYILKDTTSDYTIYRATEKYVSTTVSANLPFVVQKNNKSEKSTVEDVAKNHTMIEPPENQTKINYSTLEFSKQGDITRITEICF